MMLSMLGCDWPVTSVGQSVTGVGQAVTGMGVAEVAGAAVLHGGVVVGSGWGR